MGYNSAGICRKPLELGNCGKPDDPNSVLTSSVNHLGHVTSKGLITVKIFRVKWCIKNEKELNLLGCHSFTC